MEIKQYFGNQLRILTNSIRQVSCMQNRNLLNQNVTMLQMGILGHIRAHNGEPVFQKDIEEEMEIGKSTLSEVINVMEKNDLLKRVPFKTDGRYRELVMTEKGEAITQQFSSGAEKFNEQLCAGISDEELSICIDIIERMTENVKNIRRTN